MYGVGQSFKKEGVASMGGLHKIGSNLGQLYTKIFPGFFPNLA